MSDNDATAGRAPSRLHSLAIKTLVFLTALAASLLAGQVIYSLFGLPLQLGEMRLDAAGWITALLILMTTQPRALRHWGVVIGCILGVVVASSLGAALGELLIHRGIVWPGGGVADLAVRIGALLILWGPALLVSARLLYSSGFVVAAWEPDQPEDAGGDA